MSAKLKSILAFAVLTMSLGTLSSAQAGKLLTVPDLDWTGAIVTERTIQYVLENEMGYKFKRPTMPCLLYTSPSPRDRQKSRMPSSA